MCVASLPQGHKNGRPTSTRLVSLARIPVALGLLAAGLASGCGNGHKPPPPKAPEVIVTTPITDEVIDYQDFTGRLSAMETIDIRARATGYVTQAIPHSREGQRVAKDELLFVIDPRPYKVKLDQAVAQLESAKASAVRARNLYERAYALLGKKSGFQEDVDMRKGDLDVADAAVLEAQAKVADTKLSLDFCYVTAPSAGRISRRMADPGNLVLADNTILTSLVTEDPLYAYFDVDERTYLNLLGSSAKRLMSWSGTLQYPVLMRLANEDDFVRKDRFLHEGTVNFIDNQVTATTGTIRMRGVFRNPDSLLKPGLFARIRLPIGDPYRALLIPDEALQSDQGRKFVYVVKKGKNDKGEVIDQVDYRKVSVGQAIGGLRVIQAPAKGKQDKEGIKEGERIIVVGQQRVRPGTQVTVKAQAPPKRPESSLGKLLADNHRPAPEAGRQPDAGVAAPADAGSPGHGAKGGRPAPPPTRQGG
jgi:multidrug efflux system membrane fusion protein